MLLSVIFSHLQLKGGCSPTRDGGQVDVTGSWYNNVFTLFAFLHNNSVVLRLWIFLF